MKYEKVIELRNPFKLRNPSDSQSVGIKIFPAGTSAFVQVICRNRIFLQKLVITISIK
jgi:hypothetical protein